MKQVTVNGIGYPIVARPFRYIVIGGESTDLESMEKTFSKAYLDQAICEGRFGRKPQEKVKNLGRDRDIIRYLRLATNIQKVIYLNSNLSKRELQNLRTLCSFKGIDFVVVPPTWNVLPSWGRSDNRQILPIAIAHNQRLKRIFDIVFSILVIVFILSWMVPLLAILIKLESRGPVFFVQRRTGYLDTSFLCIKFRSMATNGECNEKQATRSDERVTRIGAFIRRNSIDEFPQFINVLLGHMSVVGPRPHMLKHTRQYSRVISNFMLRHTVKPGITGWAQVNGHRGPTETVEQMQNRVEYDLWYIDNWTFLLDFKCILMTVINFLKGEDNAC